MEYKLTIFGNNIYKEVELFKDMEGILFVGTTPRCQVRFDRTFFFDDFEIAVTKESPMAYQLWAYSLF